MQWMEPKNKAEHILWASKGERRPSPTATDALSELGIPVPWDPPPSPPHQR